MKELNKFGYKITHDLKFNTYTITYFISHYLKVKTKTIHVTGRYKIDIASI